MRILITGAFGQLGQDVAEAARAVGHVVMALPRAELDISRAEHVKQIIDANQPDLVVNCAAYTTVDQAENEPQIAFKVNRDGPANLSLACVVHSIPLIHISTDYVFDGAKREAYVETDRPRPINVYGRSKLAGEEEIQRITEQFIIIRTSWVFGAQGRNFVKTMLQLAQRHDTLRVIDDQVGCPTFTVHLAKAILEIVAAYKRVEQPWGIYHYCGQPAVSWHQFATQIFSIAREIGLPLKVKHLEAIPACDYPQPARRAANSMLSCHKIKRIFGLHSASWQEGLHKVILRYQAHITRKRTHQRFEIE